MGGPWSPKLLGGPKLEGGPDLKGVTWALSSYHTSGNIARILAT